jgi:hypothetical protein
MSIQTPSATPVTSLIPPVRKELIEIAAFDLHRAARSHNPYHTASSVHPWYIPQIAVLQTLR